MSISAIPLGASAGGASAGGARRGRLDSIPVNVDDRSVERESAFADVDGDVDDEDVADESKDELEVPQYQGAFPNHPRFLLLLFNLVFSMFSLVLTVVVVEVVVSLSFSFSCCCAVILRPAAM